MAHSIETHFDGIIQAAAKAKSQFSVIQNSSEDNQELVTAMLREILVDVAGLVFQSGGDMDVFEHGSECLMSDIGTSFFVMNEDCPRTKFKAIKEAVQHVRGANLS